MELVSWRGLLYRALLGVVVFAAIQAILFSNPPHRTTIPLENPGWFLNSGQGVMAVMAGLSVAGAVSLIFWPSTLTVSWLPVAAGAVIAMTATYVWLGGGNLFPIVIGVGTACIVAGTFLGAGAAFIARKGLKIG